ncbi:MAG: hypothetical protein CR980_00155 [Propionibacteriales bacterium]|nr:MAG: hypothetical protein CR980_00155 [Propionibacteriales bacterium]
MTWPDTIAREMNAVAAELAEHPRPWESEGLVGVLDSIRESPDDVLFRLLVACREGDQLAGRVILCALAGKIVRMANRDPRADLQDYLGAVWEQIVTYPLHRRRSVAGNIALDALRLVKRGQTVDWVTLAEDAATGQPPTPSVEVRRLFHAARRDQVVDLRWLTTAEQVYISGLSPNEVSEQQGISAAAVRWRCRRVQAELARNIDHLWVAEELLAA